MDSATKDLLRKHDASIKAFSRARLGGPPPCPKCEAETDPWWNYCAMCGHHIAAGEQ